MSEAEDSDNQAESSADAGGDEKIDSKPAARRAQEAEIAPSDGSEVSGELAAAGEKMASGLSGALDQDAPVGQRKEGVKQLGGLVSGIVNGVMEYKEQKQNREEERARSASLEETTDKPSCECGLTFTEIPMNADRIACPECGREYEVE